MASPSTTASSLDVYDNRNGQVVAGITALIVLPTVAVVLRLLSRHVASVRFGWDDYSSVFTLVLTWIPNILILVFTKRGLGKHIVTLNTTSRVNFFKTLYVFEIVYFAALTSLKYTIILFIYRAFPIVQFRRFLVTCAVIVGLFGFGTIMATTFQCTRPSDVWRQYETQDIHPHCFNYKKFAYGSNGLSTVLDFILLGAPIPLLWKLKTGFLQKLMLTTIFTLGLAVCVVSIIRIKVFSDVDLSDATWSFVPATIWSSAEPSIGLVCACLPSLRPLFAYLFSCCAPTTSHTQKHNSLHSIPKFSSTSATTRRSSSGSTTSNAGLKPMGPIDHAIDKGARPTGPAFNRLKEVGSELNVSRSRNRSPADPGLNNGNGFDGYTPGWTHRWAAYGSNAVHNKKRKPKLVRGRSIGDEEYDIGLEDHEESESEEHGGNNSKARSGGRSRRRESALVPPPEHGIRVRTTVTVTEKVEWQNHLF